MRRASALFLQLALTIAAFAASCGGDGGDEPGAATPTPTPDLSNALPADEAIDALAAVDPRLGSLFSSATTGDMRAFTELFNWQERPCGDPALGEAICRLGCYVYGCCWGRPTDSRFGVAYTSPHSKVIRFRPELQGVKIHPTQLYALTAHLIQFTIFYALLPFKVFDGMFAALYLITHPLIRFALERFRQDDRGQYENGGVLHRSAVFSTNSPCSMLLTMIVPFLKNG